MRRADRVTRQLAQARAQAEYHAKRGESGMMRMYVLSAREVNGRGLTPKQVARLEKLLAEARVPEDVMGQRVN